MVSSDSIYGQIPKNSTVDSIEPILNSTTASTEPYTEEEYLSTIPSKEVSTTNSVATTEGKEDVASTTATTTKKRPLPQQRARSLQLQRNQRPRNRLPNSLTRFCIITKTAPPDTNRNPAQNFMLTDAGRLFHHTPSPMRKLKQPVKPTNMVLGINLITI